MHRLSMPVALLGAVALLVFTWSQVVKTLTNAKPIEPGASHVSSIVWADRVFESPASLSRWLRDHGGSYETWSAHHPQQAAIIEHRRVPARPAAATKPKTKPPSGRAAERSKAISNAGAYIRDVAFTLLLLLALVLAAAAALPAPLRRRYPVLAFRVAHHRGAFAAGATAIFLGLAVSVGLS